MKLYVADNNLLICDKKKVAKKNQKYNRGYEKSQ